MPRLLPRLRQAWATVRDKVQEPRVVVSRNPRPKQPTGYKSPIEHAISVLSTQSRTHSLLFDPKNPVEWRRDYRYRRSPGPRIRGPNWVQSKIDPVRHAFPPYARRMTEKEREWWSSPYCEFIPRKPLAAVIQNFKVRMLSGPMRLCLLSNRHLPKGSSYLHL